MAVVAEELVSELIVRDGKLRAGLTSAKQAYSQGVGQMRGETRKMEQDFTRSSGAISSSFKAMAATLAAGVSTAAVGQMIDGYTRLQNQLKITGLEGAQLADVQERLRSIASTYGTDLESLATVYGRISVAAGELGASSSQILQVNEAVAAALKVSGSSAEQAQGALLQLSQAMSAGTVRAEELNSIMEGAFPLAQAAARGIERFGGSVAQLRAAILEGNVSSQEFFQGIIAGAPQLLDQAAKANLTLAQSFTVLKNELLLYVGGAASASGVSGALSAGITGLANNLDRIIPALAVITAAIGVRYVAAAGAAVAATVAQTVALNGMAGAARLAGASMIAALGGPVTAALTALGAAVFVVAEAVRDTAPSLADLNSTLAESQKLLADAQGQAQKAGAAVDGAGNSAKSAANSWGSFNDILWAGVRAMDAASNSARNLALSRLRLQNAEAQQTIAEVSPRVQGLEAAAGRNRRFNAFFGQNVSGYEEMTAGDRARLDVDRQRLNVAEDILATNKESERLILSNEGFTPTATNTPVAGSGTAAAGSKKSKAGAGSSGPTQQEIQDRYNAELQRGLVELEQVNAGRRQNASEQAAAETARIRVEQDITARSIKADADYSQAQKNMLLVLNDQLALARISAIDAEETARLLDEKHELMQLDADLQRDALQREYELAGSQKERRSIAMQMLDIEERVRTAKLDELLAQENLSDAVRARAERERAAIDGEFNQRRESANRDTESPLEQYRRESRKTADQIVEDMERAQVQGFDALGDGITNAIMGTESLGSVFKKVTNQIIADLIRIAVQQTVVNSLMGGLFGGGGGGGLFGGGGGLFGGGGGGLSTGLFGRAGGGRVSAGQLYRINESGQEYFRPASDGTVISAAQMNTAAMRGGNSGQPVVVQISVSEGALFEPTVQRISGDVSIQAIQASAPSIIRAAGAETQRKAMRPRP